MASFKDSKDRQWTLKLDAPTIRAIRQECDGLDLVAEDDSPFKRITADPVLLVEVLWILCREQAKSLSPSLSYEQFAEGLAGDILDSATAAMVESVADFFPKRRKELILAVANKASKLRDLGIAKAMQRVNDPRLEEALLNQIDEQMESVLTGFGSATSGPAPAESPPSG